MTAGSAVGAYFVLPTDGWVPAAWQVAIGWTSAVAVVVGVRVHRPAAGIAWYLFALGLFLNSSGIGVEAVLSAHGYVLDPPSLPDALYLSLYPALAAGLTVVVMRRRTRREWAGLVDAMMISTGVGLLAWVAVIRPALGDPQYSTAGQVVTIAYPIGDLVLLAMVVRLVVAGGARGVAFRLLAAAVSTFLLGDTTWAVLNQFALNPTAREQSLLSMVFLAAYVLLGAAALHPSMPHLTRPEANARSVRGLAMIAVLTAVALIAPTLLMVQAARHRVTDGVAIAVGSMALFLLVILRMGLLYRQVQDQAATLRRLSEVDELTGLPNRRSLGTNLDRAVARSQRDGSPLALAMLDLDCFKLFNDDHGHPAGDELLRTASAAWLGELRTADVISRYGGEEFVLVLPDTDPDAALDVVERLRAATPAGQTFSAGLAHWDGTETAADLIARADLALYEAKRSGRNRTVLAGAAPSRPPRATRGPNLSGHRRPAPNPRVDEPA